MSQVQKRLLPGLKLGEYYKKKYIFRQSNNEIKSILKIRLK